MCGRFSLTIDPSAMQIAFPEFIFPNEGQVRYNIAPSQPVLVLPNDGNQTADYFTWGLVPAWAKDPTIGYRMINARAETLAEKPAFRSAYKYRRCLIFANGFYEWMALPGSKSKVPHFIHLRSGEPFAFAGLWEHWQSPEGSEINSTTIITTTPNELVRPIHDRMPVILPRSAYAQWIDTKPRFPVDLNALLVPFPAAEMEAYPISMLVNSPGNDQPEIQLKV
jgi:putative SOS response-associated peptidase YedK